MSFFPLLLALHSGMRWLLLISLLLAIFSAYRGYTTRRMFTKTDNALRHWTATFAHIQLILGTLVYSYSPVIQYFWKNKAQALPNFPVSFFAIVHLLFMLSAIVVLTLGSALAKRKATDTEKFKTMLVWFSIALVIIFVAIPWPFSPFATRPYFRSL